MSAKDLRGSWPEDRTGLLQAVDGLDGQILFSDAASCSAVARDAGGIVSMLPRAVVRPRSIDDVVHTLRFCGRHGIAVAARGRGHTTFGQAQVEGGLVIDMTSLDRIHRIVEEYAVVDAGVTWRRLLVETTARGLRPPVLTGFQGLSVGGTLSVGGVSGVSYNRGSQVDHVLELDVVTGDGEFMTCSEKRNAGLFRAVLAGRGRCAIIVRATLRLVPAASHARHTSLCYSSVQPFLRDLRELADQGRLDGISGTITLSEVHGPRYELNALRFFTPPDAPDTLTVRGCTGVDATTTTDFKYLDYCLVVDRLLEQLATTAGWEGLVHPWFDVFLSDSHVETYLSEVVPALDPKKDVGPLELGSLGQIHLFPLLTQHLTRPLLRVPHGKLVYLFDILTSSHGAVADAAYPLDMLHRNRRLYRRARELGGTPYSISAIPLSVDDHVQYLGEAYSEFAEQKRRFDPNGVLRGFA